MLKVLSSPHVDASALSAMLGEGDSSDVERLLALRAAGDGEMPNFSPRDDMSGATDSLGINAMLGAGRSNMMSLADSMKQQQNKTAEDLKNLSKDMKKKLFGGSTKKT